MSREGDAYAVQLADRMRDRLQPRWASLSSRAMELVARADDLLKRKDADVAKGAAAVKEAIVKTMASLSNLMTDELRGSNDPEFRARMETGRNEHKRIQSDSSKCTASELTFGSRRVDCIRVDGATCYVVEIKPNNEAARDRGRQQIEQGIKEIRGTLDGKKKRAELTGKLEVLRACFDESTGRVDLKEELRVYEYCPPEGELFKDFVVP